jgi:hypothetical protein
MPGYELWATGNEEYTADARRAVCLKPNGQNVIGYICRNQDGTWIIEGDWENRRFYTGEDAADVLIIEWGDDEGEARPIA